MFRYHILVIICFCWLCQLVNAQTRMVMDANVYLTLSDTGHLVVDNPNNNGITVASTANIISEGENNAVKWVIGNNLGNYVIPFTTNSFVKIPLALNINTAGVGSTGNIIFSTYETSTDKNNNYPSDVTNLNSNCKDSVGLQAVDRFWRIDAQNYSTKPTPIINFGFDNAANEVAITNTINTSALKAMRFNNSINSWETPQKLFGIATTNTVNNAIVLPTDFYKSWTLIDTTSMNIPIVLTSALSVSICNGSLAVISATGATTYTLLPNNIMSTTNFTVSPTANTTYSLIGSIGSGTAVCSSVPSNSTMVAVTVNPIPILTSTVTNIACYGNSTGAITTELVTSSACSYTWSNNTYSGDLSGVSAGIYVVTIQDANLCSTTQTIAITQPSVSMSIQITDLNGNCLNQSNGSVTITAVGGTPAYTYSWQPIVNNTNMLNNVPNGNYTVFCTDANGCKTSTIVSISVFSNPVLISLNNITPATCQQNNGSISIDIIGGTSQYIYEWLPINIATQNLNNIYAGNYTVIVTDNLGCTDSLTITLDCKVPIFIPEILTPNSDEKNDVFEIKGIENYPNNQVNIFNRWGNLVYTKKQYDNSFNGKSNISNSIGSGLLPAGTYFVIIDFGDSETKTYNGYVELKY